MTKLLERAIARAKDLPDKRQDEVGAILLALVEQDESSVRLSDAQQAEVRRRVATAEPFVPDHEMQAFFRKLAMIVRFTGKTQSADS
jgi:hypothetical protein